MKLKTSIALIPAISTAQEVAGDAAGSTMPFPFMPQLRRFNTMVNMAFNTVTTDFNRHDFEDRIKKYGCHCFPGSNKDADPKRRHAAIGVGPAVDEIDSVCQTLAKCHRCVELRFPGEIDVNDGRYDPYGKKKGKKIAAVAGASEFDCSFNKSAAKRALCECDTEFAIKLGRVWNDTNHDPHYWQNNRNLRQMETRGTPVFDYDATCNAKSSRNAKGPGGSDDGAQPTSTRVNTEASNFLLQLSKEDQVDNQCCGPNYIPYNTNVRSCCVNGDHARLYDHNLLECCEDGTVQGFGTC